MPSSSDAAAARKAHNAHRDDSYELLVRNLRLLDLDRHPECPRLASHLFKDSDAPDDKRVRVERVEWLLYHVFEQWDTVNTAERLQPYFPPLEPRQSTGLHAALFRWLSELKRDGVLARPVQLRNGMLDECKGDAVLPLLLAFSTAALRKSTTKRLGPSVGLRLAHDDFLPRRDQLLLEPLLLAHRASLAGELHRRREQGRRYEELDGLLRSKLSGIAQRFEKLETDADDVDALRPAEADALRRRFEDHWLGDPAWLDVVISGYHQGRSDPLLIAPFDDVWQHAKSETIKQLQAGSQRGLLEKLEERLRTQQGRIEHWKAFHNALSGEKRGESVTRALSTGAVIPQQAPDPPLEARRCSADEGTARGPAPGPDESLPSSISGDDADASDWDTASDDEKGEPSKESSPHGGALDGRRPDEVLISDEKLGQKGKKGNIVHDADANLTDEADHLSISKPPITVVKDNDQARSADKQTEKISNKKSDTDGMSAMQIETGMRSQYKAGRLSPLGPEEQELLAEQEKPHRTLAERARMSMALARGDESPTASSDPRKDALPRHTPTARWAPPVESSAAFASLVERTQQSMGGLPPTSSRRQTQKAQRRVSQAKTHLATPLVEDRRPKTPPTHEELFTQEADYDAVFRSRPKIKLSPVVSPEREREERLSEVFEDADEDEEDEEAGLRAFESSPLGRMGIGKV